MTKRSGKADVKAPEVTAAVHAGEVALHDTESFSIGVLLEAITGVNSRLQQEISRRNMMYRSIEKVHNLPEGSIGKTYMISEDLTKLIPKE